MKRLILIALFVLSVCLMWGQVAAWDFTGASEVATWDATVYETNLSSDNTITRGTGATASEGSNSFRTTGFQNNGISVSNTDYFQVTLSPQANYLMSLTTINARVTGTTSYAASPGVQNQFAYSTDGTNFTLIGSPSVTIGTNQTFSVAVNAVAALQNVIAETTIYIRYYASGQTSTGGWGFYSNTSGNYGLSIEGAVTSTGSTPSITVTPTTLTGFTYVQGSGPSGEQSFAVSGTNLTANIGITPPANYQISTGTGGSFVATNPITLTQTGGSVAETTIYVRLAAGLSTGTYNGQTITATSTDASDRTVTCSGSVTAPPNPEPTNHVTGFSATATSYSQIDLSWTDATGANLPAGYLVKANLTGTFDDPVDGTDPATDTNLADGSALVKVAHGARGSYSFTGLTANTHYYFKIWSYSNSGTSINFKTDGTVPVDNETTPVAPVMVPPSEGVVFISEVSEGPSTATEYLELYNMSSEIVDLSNSKLVRVTASTNISDYVFDFASDGSGDTSINPNGILIIARGATKTAFETAWGVLGADVKYNEGHANLYFATDTARRWRLRNDTSRTSDTDDGTLIDDTEAAVGGTGNRSYQQGIGDWVTETYSGNSTPGELDNDQTLPVTLSSFDYSINEANQLSINWETQSESDLLGFNLYRNTTNTLPEAALNFSLIPPLGSVSAGAEYTYPDVTAQPETDYYYWLESQDQDLSSHLYGPIFVYYEIDDNHDNPPVNVRTQLFGAYPNPFNPVTNIQYSLSAEESTGAALKIYNTRGQLVQQFSNLTPGEEQHVTWQGKDLTGKTCTTGIYFYKLETAKYSKTAKMMMIK